MKICPKHRHQIGKFWRPLRTCQYPGHEGKVSRSVKGSHVIHFKMAKDIQMLFSRTVPVGSRKHLLQLLHGSINIFLKFENRQT